MSKTKFGEWFWRFLSIVMLFTVGWTIWIIYQLNPPPLIMTAAFEAAAAAKGKGAQYERQVTKGVIAPPQEEAKAPAAPELPKVPPINPEKLKFSDTIALPVPPNAKK
jgi:hypothetical protein